MKPAIRPVRWHPPPVRSLPDFGPAELTLLPVGGDAPEDVVVDEDGFGWTGVADGRILRIAPDGSIRTVANTGGRPLGLAPAADGALLICDSPRGLLRMDRDTGVIETLVESIAGRPLRFCSNAVEMADGTIYFTESSASFTVAHYQAAILEARGDGALHRRDPDGTVTTVVSGLYFANGVTATADGSAVVFAETQARRLSTYRETGSRAATVTPLATDLPGMPDNLSTGADGRIWCAMVSPIHRAAELLAPRAPVLRRIAWRLPERLQPPIPPTVWAVAFDADTGAAVAGVRMTHPNFGLVTGVVEHQGRLWMSSLGHPALAHCPIPETHKPHQSHP